MGNTEIHDIARQLASYNAQLEPASIPSRGILVTFTLDVKGRWLPINDAMRGLSDNPMLRISAN